jgi:hypothetical protein
MRGFGGGAKEDVPTWCRQQLPFPFGVWCLGWSAEAVSVHSYGEFAGGRNAVLECNTAKHTTRVANFGQEFIVPDAPKPRFMFFTIQGNY